MSESTQLERRYRRLLAWYPQAFREEHEEEMLVVLMAGDRDGRRGPGLADSADLIRTAIRLRLCPAAPQPARTVVWAVRSMILGAVLELITLVTVLGTQGDVKSAVVRQFPHFTAAQWHAVVHAHILPVEVGAPIAAALWLWTAWANGRGWGWARVLTLGLFALTSISLLSAFAQHATTYAAGDLAAGCVLWLIGLVTVLLIFNPHSDQHYRRPPASTRPRGGRAAARRLALQR